MVASIDHLIDDLDYQSKTQGGGRRKHFAACSGGYWLLYTTGTIGL